jgi:hypothetical protein
MGMGERVKGRWGSWEMVNYFKKVNNRVYKFENAERVTDGG